MFTVKQLSNLQLGTLKMAEEFTVHHLPSDKLVARGTLIDRRSFLSI